MKQFFKFVLATFVGLFLASLIMLFIVIGIIAGATSGDKDTNVEPNSVLRIAIDYNIDERTPNNPLAGLDFLGLGNERSVGLKDILANIKKAKTDDNIKGIYLDESQMSAGEATVEEIRNALIDFKTSGKFIIAYSEVYSQSFYYLASVADKVY